jgi:hypothetical protein
LQKIIVARRRDDDRRGRDGYFFAAQGFFPAQGFFAAQGLPAAQGFFFAAVFFAAVGFAFAAQGLADFGAQGLLCARAGPARPRANALTRAICSDLLRIFMVIPPLVIIDRRALVAIPRKA